MYQASFAVPWRYFDKRAFSGRPCRAKTSALVNDDTRAMREMADIHAILDRLELEIIGTLLRNTSSCLINTCFLRTEGKYG